MYKAFFTSRQSRLLWLDFSMCLSVWQKWKWNVWGRANLVTHATTYFHLVLIWCWFSSWSSELNFRYSHAGRRDLGPFFVKLWNSIVGCVTRKAHNYRIAPDNLVLATCSDCLSTIMQTQGWQKTNVGHWDCTDLTCTLTCSPLLVGSEKTFHIKFTTSYLLLRALGLYPSFHLRRLHCTG